MTHNTVRINSVLDTFDPFFDVEEMNQPHPLQDEQLDMFDSPAYASLTRVTPGKRARRILRPVY